ncbi:MAG: PIN domain nuclease [Desulfobacteraceae bacterium]|nr:PIN domain nuclease [Desulfobacteraceae bacterium]
MVVIDTSVWIDFFRNPAADGNGRLEELIRENNRAAVCGLILQEILQGIKDQKLFALTRQRLLFLPYLEAPRDVHLLAADLYRHLRAKGVTVPSTDTIIAAVAIHHGFPLFTRDAHFSEIARHSELRLYS